MGAPRLVLASQSSLAEVRKQLDHWHLPGAPVVDERGAFIGTVLREQVTPADPEGSETTELGRLADPTSPTTTVDAHLDSALESLVTSRTNWIPVLDQDRRVVGTLSVSELVRGYRA
ncbi:MAG: CBS domain-containing protein, partial [Acidimicrobiales bacterium]